MLLRFFPRSRIRQLRFLRLPRRRTWGQEIITDDRSDSLQYEPCGVLVNAESSTKFIAADAIFAICQDPDGDHPFIKSERGIFKNSSHLQTELLLTVVAKPDAASLDEGMFRSATTWTGDVPLRPSQSLSEVERSLRIAEVNHRSLECFWCVHKEILH